MLTVVLSFLLACETEQSSPEVRKHQRNQSLQKKWLCILVAVSHWWVNSLKRWKRNFNWISKFNMEALLKWRPIFDRRSAKSC